MFTRATTKRKQPAAAHTKGNTAHAAAAEQYRQPIAQAKELRSEKALHSSERYSTSFLLVSVFILP